MTDKTKRICLSIGASLLLISSAFGFATAYELYFALIARRPSSDETADWFALSVTWPELTWRYLANPGYKMPNSTAIWTISAEILLYAAVFYALFTKIAVRRPAVSASKIEVPPPPPEFAGPSNQ